MVIGKQGLYLDTNTKIFKVTDYIIGSKAQFSAITCEGHIGSTSLAVAGNAGISGNVGIGGTLTGGSVKTAAGVDLDTHNHDSRYYTETEVNNLLNGKAASNHTHAAANITNLGTNYNTFTTKSVANGTWTNVLSVTLPAGTYIVTAHTSISGTPACRMLLYFGTSSSTTNMGDSIISDDNNNRAICNVCGGVRPTGNTTYYLRCYHSAGSTKTVYCGYDITRIK